MTDRINNNAYKLDLPLEYGVHDTFNLIDLSPFVGTNDDDELDLRTNPFQGGGDDGGGPSTSHHGSQDPRLDRDERLASRKERLGIPYLVVNAPSRITFCWEDQPSTE